MQKIEKVQVLEPIQEESEQEDETVGRKEEEEKEVEKEDELPFQVGVETEEALAENEREEDDVPLMVQRPGRRSGSRKLESLIQIQFNEQTKETETSSVLDPSTHSTHLCEEAAPLPVLGYERRLSSRRLRLKVRLTKLFIFVSIDIFDYIDLVIFPMSSLKVSKTMWQKCTKSHQPKKRKSLRYKEVQVLEFISQDFHAAKSIFFCDIPILFYLKQEPFPQWLVNLMVDIDEATTHQLVIE